MLKNRLTSLTSQDLYTRLNNINTPVSATRIHGMVTGMVCAGIYANGRSWVEMVLGLLHPRSAPHARVQTSRRTLIELYYFISEQLTDDGQLFTLLLPEHFTGVTERAIALTNWCTGFLDGLRLLGLTDYHAFVPAVADALYHCSEIAELDFDSIACDEEDKVAMEQAMEYVRVTAILVYDALCGGQLTGLQAYHHYQTQLLTSSEEVMH